MPPRSHQTSFLCLFNSPGPPGPFRPSNRHDLVLGPLRPNPVPLLLSVLLLDFGIAYPPLRSSILSLPVSLSLSLILSLTFFLELMDPAGHLQISTVYRGMDNSFSFC